MADFSFGFAEGSFLLLNGQNHLKSVPEDLISNKQKRTKRIIKNGQGTNIIKLSTTQANISQQVIALSDFHLACENEDAIGIAAQPFPY